MAPPLPRRLLCMLYEGVLLFGVLMFAGLVYGLVTQQRHALVGSNGLKAFLFVVLGLYFVYFWTRNGQTLAMLTWRLKLLGPEGRPPSPARACARYLLAWLWFVPALLVLRLLGFSNGWVAVAVVVGGVLLYALLSHFAAGKQFWHDVLCQTRLVDSPLNKSKS